MRSSRKINEEEQKFYSSSHLLYAVPKDCSGLVCGEMNFKKSSPAKKTILASMQLMMLLTFDSNRHDERLFMKKQFLENLKSQPGGFKNFGDKKMKVLKWIGAKSSSSGEATSRRVPKIQQVLNVMSGKENDDENFQLYDFDEDDYKDEEISTTMLVRFDIPLVSNKNEQQKQKLIPSFHLIDDLVIELANSPHRLVVATTLTTTQQQHQQETQIRNEILSELSRVEETCMITGLKFIKIDLEKEDSSENQDEEAKEINLF
jgi:hypothetical protein